MIDGVNFYTDSDLLNRPATLILDQVAQSLALCANTPVTIAAHTDNIGDLDYNQRLSQKRAASVVEYLNPGVA